MPGRPVNKEDSLTYYGRCRNCHGVFAKEARVVIEDLSDECPECGGKLDYRFAAHRHPMRRDRAGKRLILVLSVLAAIVTGAAVLLQARLHRGYSAEEIASAQKTVSPMTMSDILKAFQEDRIGDSTLASILHASSYTLGRLRSGDTFPTPAMDAAIRGLYTDYLLLGGSRFLLLCRYGLRGTDLFYAFPNPLQETGGEAYQASLP